jgi:hypothetical protein
MGIGVATHGSLFLLYNVADMCIYLTLQCDKREKGALLKVVDFKYPQAAL